MDVHSGERRLYRPIALGVPFMDEEHAYLFAVYEMLTTAMTLDPGNRWFADRFRELAAYARDHFAHEEFLMAKFRYPLYVAHKQAHEALLRDAEDFAVNIMSCYERYACYGVTLYLRRWLRSHIVRHDRLLARSLRPKPDMTSPRLLVPVLPPCTLRRAAFPPEMRP